jgi:hypothetical protein
MCRRIFNNVSPVTVFIATSVEWLACWPLVPKLAGSNPAEAVGFDFSGEKILSMPSFGGEVKPSAPCCSFAACKKPYIITVEVAIVWLNFIGHFSPIVPPFADRGLSRRLTWSASGDERGN